MGQLMAYNGPNRGHFLRQRQIQRMTCLDVIFDAAVHSVPQESDDGNFSTTLANWA